MIDLRSIRRRIKAGYRRESHGADRAMADLKALCAEAYRLNSRLLAMQRKLIRIEGGAAPTPASPPPRSPSNPGETT